MTSAGSRGRGAHSRRAVLKRAHPHGHVLPMHPPPPPHGARPDEAQAAQLVDAPGDRPDRAAASRRVIQFSRVA